MTRRALVVHPDASIGGRIQDECERAGFVTAHVRDGERAIDRFVQEPAEVLVVDVELPGRDGAATVESMRWAPGGDRLVVILTGTTSSSGRLASVARELGATATLPGANPRLGPLRGVLAGLRSKPAPTGRRAELDATSPANLGWPVPGGDPAGHGGFEDDLLTLPGHRDSTPTPARGVSTVGISARPHAGQTLQGQPAIAPRVSGKLKETPFARLLTRLAEQRAGGVLHLSALDGTATTTTSSGPVQKRIYFRAGVPTHVESNRLDETLGAMLVRAAKVSSDVVETGLERVHSGEGRLGGILVAMNALDPHALREALEAQQRERIFELFRWADGSFHFIDEPPTPPGSVALELSLVELIFEGVMGRLSPPLALSWLAPHAKRYVLPDARRLRPFLDRPLPDFAQRTLSRLDGQSHVSALLATSPSRRAYMAQLLFALECVGAVAFRDNAQAVEEPSLLGPSAGAVAGTVESIAEMDRLASLLKEKRWAEALGVTGDDPRAIDRAAENLDARLRPLAETGAAPREVRTRAYAVLAGIARARRRLLDDVSSSVEPPHDMAAPGDEPNLPAEDAPRRKRPTDRPTVAAVPAAYEAAVQVDTHPERKSPAPPDSAAVGADGRAKGEAEGTSEMNPFADSVGAPTFAEGVPTFLGEVLASAHEGAGVPAWDDLTLPEPSFDDVTVPGDVGVPLPPAAFRPPTVAGPTAPSDRDLIPTRAIELSEDQALTVPGGVQTSSETAAQEAAAQDEAAQDEAAQDEAAQDEAAQDEAAQDEAAEADGGSRDVAPQAAPPTKPNLDPRELDLEVERMLQAERAFRRGKRALKKGLLKDAIEHFETAERLCPQEGEFLAALGEALWREDPQAARARELLERGCDLAPHLAPPHLALAALLERADDAAGARVAYERALAANPNEAAAVEGLRLLEGN